MELFIKVYETCPACKGTGWIEEDPEDIWDEPHECFECCNGKVERLIKINTYDKRTFGLYMYLKNKIENKKYEIEKDK